MPFHEGMIQSLFQGISKQPPSVRYPGQVEDAENTDFSVETGGFSTRLGLRLKKKIAGLATGVDRRLHVINRDASEKYRMVLYSGGCKIYDANYNAVTVNIDAANTTWLTEDPDNFALMTAIDYTFIVKKTQIVAKTGADFDATTMPRAFVRGVGGDFTLGINTWTACPAGPPPDPEFVGGVINDLVFFRNRIGFLTGETAYFGQQGDYFNFWPDSSTAVLDSDPFGVTSTTNQVSRFYFASPFRRSIFVMADNAQFEVSGDAMTPALGAIDLATSYAASTVCRPVAIGDELYFPVESGNVATLLSYSYDQNTVSETAEDVTKHVLKLIPATITELVGDPVQGRLYALSDETTDTLYVHTFFYQGENRVQSAWGKYQFDNVKILSMGIINGVVQLLIEYDSAVWLAELPSREDLYADWTWTPRLDFNWLMTGTYDAGTDRTTWDLTYTPTNPAAITSNLFPASNRMLSLPLTISGTTVYTTGDWSAHPVMLGETFNSYVTFSPQYVRDQNSVATLDAKLKLKKMALNYSETGYFEVDVTPLGRDTITKVFNARRLGAVTSLIQSFPVLTGTFRFTVGSDAVTTKITVISDHFLPFTIVSAAWLGQYTQVAEQG
jgi:hypothetical protein